MKRKTFWWAIGAVAALVLAAGIWAVAQDAPLPVHLSGLINDYTPSKSTPESPTTGPWEVRGVWSLRVKEDSDHADFSAALTMEHSDEGVVRTGGDFDNPKVSRHAHTHHITLVDGEITPIPNGFRVTGPATITGNGNFPPPDFGVSTTLQIDVTGGNSVEFSNIAVTFIGDAANHFGQQPFHGVVLRPEHSDRDDAH